MKKVLIGIGTFLVGFLIFSIITLCIVVEEDEKDRKEMYEIAYKEADISKYYKDNKSDNHFKICGPEDKTKDFLDYNDDIYNVFISISYTETNQEFEIDDINNYHLFLGVDKCHIFVFPNHKCIKATAFVDNVLTHSYAERYYTCSDEDFSRLVSSLQEFITKEIEKEKASITESDAHE